jgi:hypothetical protein
MSFQDFIDGSWIVQWSTTSCRVGSMIHFGGDGMNVTVRCNNDPYKPGRYFPKEDVREERIESQELNEYTIAIIAREPRFKIRADFSGAVGGSWTAEDNAGPEEGG